MKTALFVVKRLSDLQASSFSNTTSTNKLDVLSRTNEKCVFITPLWICNYWLSLRFFLKKDSEFISCVIFACKYLFARTAFVRKKLFSRSILSS